MTHYRRMLVHGVELGPYRLQRPLRDGQVGTAFFATRPGADGFEKSVVIRCTAREHLGRVVDEANRAARLSHAGIAHVLDAGAFGDQAYVVSEQVPGPTLQSWLLRMGRIPWALAAHVVREAAAALAYAHTRRNEEGALLRIVHRRLTPRRLTLRLSDDVEGPSPVDGQDPVEGPSPVDGPKGRLYGVTITGLGASWAWPDHQGFGAPEEMREEPVDARADVYALGVILRRCAGPDAPAGLGRAIEHAMEPYQEHRCTASELRETLTSLLRSHVGAPPPRCSHDRVNGLGPR